MWGNILISTSCCKKSESAPSLANTEWRFVWSIDTQNGESITYFGGGDHYRLIFDTGTAFSLNPSCNYSSRDYESTGNRISFTRVAPGTAMGCQNPSNDWESFFISRLSGAHSYSTTGKTLVISNDNYRLSFTRSR